jgi:Ca2+-binding RTX toxin-like protein
MYTKKLPTDHDEEGEVVVRRVGLLLVMMTVALILSSGVALAGYFVGTRGDDRLRGTNRADEMYGLKGDDRIEGRGKNDYIEGGGNNDRLFGDSENDEIYGGRGEDEIFGGEGDDFLNAADGRAGDKVDCGGGNTDEAVVDTGDTVVGGIGPGAPCEAVTTVL